MRLEPVDRHWRAAQPGPPWPCVSAVDRVCAALREIDTGARAQARTHRDRALDESGNPLRAEYVAQLGRPSRTIEGPVRQIWRQAPPGNQWRTWLSSERALLTQPCVRGIRGSSRAVSYGHGPGGRSARAVAAPTRLSSAPVPTAVISLKSLRIRRVLMGLLLIGPPGTQRWRPARPPVPRVSALNWSGNHF
jgi:hypothetical protein